MKQLLVEFLKMILEVGPSTEDPVLTYADKTGKQRKAKASTLSTYE